MSRIKTEVEHADSYKSALVMTETNQYMLLCWSGSLRNCIWSSEKLISNPASLTQTTKESAMHCGRVVSDCVLPGKEHTWQI